MFHLLTKDELSSIPNDLTFRQRVVLLIPKRLAVSASLHPVSSSVLRIHSFSTLSREDAGEVVIFKRSPSRSSSAGRCSGRIVLSLLQINACSIIFFNSRMFPG